MKNQYFGDISDYRKYGLLRALCCGNGTMLLLAWMRTADDGSADGGFRSYLQDPGHWRGYDPELFDGLTALLRSSAAAKVSLMARCDLLKNTGYFAAEVPDHLSERDAWRRGLIDAARGVDVVFLDPDNGIEVASKPVGRKGSSKYVIWNETEDLWNTGCSLLIYQHYCREQRAAFAQRLASGLRARSKASLVKGFHTRHVLFLLAAQDRHAAVFRERIPLLKQRWGAEIQAIEFD